MDYVFALLAAYLAISALTSFVSGRITFNGRSGGFIAERAEEPTLFWAILIVEVLGVGALVWDLTR